LVDAGFISVERRSAFTLKSRRAQEYALSWHPIGNRPPTLGWHNVINTKDTHGPSDGTDGPASGTMATPESARRSR
jgi:hypothetical protein